MTLNRRSLPTRSRRTQIRETKTGNCLLWVVEKQHFRPSVDSESDVDWTGGAERAERKEESQDRELMEL